jgi:23S rRNA (cytosine1962-C5)-methyltransferase
MEKLTVSSETARMLQLGHPWVIADAATRRWPKTLQPGQLVQLVDPQGQPLVTALLDPADRVAARVIDRQPLAQLGPEWVARRLRRALALRQTQLELNGTDAWRLVNAEGDGFPGLTIDHYGDYLMLQAFTRAWDSRIDLLANELEKLLQPQGIYLKYRPQQTRKLESRGGLPHNKLLRGKPVGTKLTVQENGLNFLVDLDQGLHTGLFMDQRGNRRDLMARCQGKRVLNLFSFTGAFSVAAAAAGARQVTSVDASGAYLKWAEENFSVNRLNPKQHRFLTGDCFKVLEEVAAAGEQYDIVLMDPPSFSTTRKSRFTTRGGTSDLVTTALSLLSDDGLLITSSNHQKVAVADYLKELRRGALAAGVDLQVLEMRGQGGDFPYTVGFPEGRYLKYVISRKA